MDEEEMMSSKRHPCERKTTQEFGSLLPFLPLRLSKEQDL